MKAYVIEKEKLAQNIEIVKNKANGKPIYGVIKGDGYGLGMLRLAEVLREHGISRFAVTEPSDAMQLRENGFVEEDILVMRPVVTEADVHTLLDAHATATVGSYDAAVVLNGIAEKRGELVDVHLKLDTGMGRYGFQPDETDRILSVYKFLSKLTVTGLYTHFYIAFASQKKTKLQLDALLAMAQRIRDAGYDPGVIHGGNSASLMGGMCDGLDAIRVGSAFTGHVAGKNSGGLQSVGYAVCSVNAIRWLNEQHTVGYGGAFVTKKPTRTAVIPFGYADGFCVARKNDIFRFRDKLRYLLSDLKLFLRRKQICVTIRGKRAPVLGHIGMLHTVADITGITCELGDEVIFQDVNPMFVPASVTRIMR